MTPKELQFVLDEGEGQKIEFKEAVSSSLDKDLAALATASGGRIFLGVNDSNEISGITVTNELKVSSAGYRAQVPTSDRN